MFISFTWSLLFFLIAIGLLAMVHELGHFLVARWCSVRVERFSLGLGKPIARFVGKGGTEYVISPIPLGGYVKLLDETEPYVQPEGLALSEGESFNSRPIWQRMAIIAAGPLANFILALLLYWIALLVGSRVLRPVVEYVLPDSVAARSGVVSQVEVISISGKDTLDWEAVNLALMREIGSSKVVVGLRKFDGQRLELAAAHGESFSVELDLGDSDFDLERQSMVESLGIVPKLAEVKPQITAVEQGSAADEAGLRVGDTILRLEGNTLGSWQEFAQLVASKPLQPVQLTVHRDTVELHLTLLPRVKQLPDGRQVGYAGVAPQVLPLASIYQIDKRCEPLAAISKASLETWSWTKLTISFLRRLLVGEWGVGQLSGPISIARGAGASAEAGLVSYLKFLALISINLGVVNLFPLPVLDGGRLLFLSFEGLFGNPLPKLVEIFCYRISMLILTLLLGIAVFNDIMRLLMS